jgi:hypothetical protein
MWVSFGAVLLVRQVRAMLCHEQEPSSRPTGLPAASTRGHVHPAALVVDRA